MELIVVLIIVGILAVVAVANYSNSIWQAKVQGVERNLMAISAAEQKYYEDHGVYYISGNNTDFNGINSSLSLSMGSVNDGFVNYQCTGIPANLCFASNPSAPPSGQTYKVSVDSSANLTCTYNSLSVICP